MMGTFIKRTKAVLICFFILSSSILIFSGNIGSENGTESDNFDVATLGLLWKVQRDEDISTLWNLDWSPDGSKIAVVYLDNTTIIYDGETGDILKALNGSTKTGSNRNTRCDADISDDSVPLLLACDWAPDGKYLATAGSESKIRIYNSTTWEIEKVLTGHQSWINTLDWSPNGTRIASGSGVDNPLQGLIPMPKIPDENALVIWDVASGKRLLNLREHNHCVLSVKWSYKGDRLATASDDRTINIWNASNGDITMILGGEVGHTGGVLDADWAPDETKMVSGSRDYKMRLWNLSDGLPIGNPWKDDNCVRSVDWHPNGKIIASSGVDSVLKIRDGEDGEILREFPEAKKTRSVVKTSQWSPDGQKLAAGAGKERILRVYSFGQASALGEDVELLPRWAPGVFVIAIIGVGGVIIIYYPMINKIRERRK